MTRIATLSLLLSVLPLTMAACDAEPEPDPVGPAQEFSDVEYEIIDAAAIDALAPDETITVNDRDGVVWILDFESGSLDLSRIEILCGNGVYMPLDEWFQMWGHVPAEDTGGRLIMVRDPADFGTLDPDQVEYMRSLLDPPVFRGIYTEVLNDVSYLVCPSDSQFSCDDGVTWEDF